MSYQRKKSLLRGLTYLLQRIVFKPYMVGQSEQLGVKLKFKSEDIVGRHIYKYDIYEPETTNALLNNIKLEKGDIMLDIGANIGWYSMVFAKQGASVLSFEPDPLNYQLLKDNVSLNHFEDLITPHMLAVSDKKTVMPLYLYPNVNRGRHSLNPMEGCEKVDVDVVCLDDFLVEQNIDTKKIKLIKIDIEGHEYPALKGGGKLLENVPYLLVEHAPDHIIRGGYNPNDIVDLLGNNGYIPFKITPDTIEELTVEALRNDNSEQNILWQKKDAS